jgi:phenylpropionate dioxygenase-like ring-hydroxylating dioxygenase large terminal subunit
MTHTASTESVLHDRILHAQWFVVAESSEVPTGKPVARRLLGSDIVLWRDSTAIHVWQDLCIHRGAKLSLGTVRATAHGDCLVCPYHAWQYDASGRCVHIPAQPDRTPPVKARANVFQAQERYGLIWVCPGEPIGPVPDFPFAEDPAFRVFLCGPYTFEAQGPRLIENFLDVSHLAIVHEGLLGDADHAAIADYDVDPGDAGLTPNGGGPVSQNLRIHQPNPDSTGQAAEVDYAYRVHTPLTASFVKSQTTNQGANQLLMGYSITPIEEQTSLAWSVFAMNYGFDIPEESLRAFQDTVAYQDKAIVESQRPELLPLDLQEELHLRSDRMAIAYRTWLKTTGLRYGIA